MALKDIVFGLKLKDGQFKAGIAGARKGIKSLDNEKLGGLKSRLNGITKDLGGMGKALSKFGPLIGASLGVGAGLSFGALFTKSMAASVEARTIDAQLKNSLSKIGQGGAFEGLNKLGDTIRQAFAFDDEEVRAGFTTMINAGMRAEQVQKNAALVADVARAKQISYGEAAEVVSKAFNGQLRALKSVGIYINSTKNQSKDAVLAMNALQSKFGGAAGAAADAMSPLERIKLTVADSLQLIGDKLLPMLEPMIVNMGTAFREFVDSGKLEQMVIGFMGMVKNAKEFITWIDTAFNRIFAAFSDGTMGDFLVEIIQTAIEVTKAGLTFIGEFIGNAVLNGAPRLMATLVQKFVEMLQEVLGPKISKMLGIGKLSDALKKGLAEDTSFADNNAASYAAFKKTAGTALGKLGESAFNRFGNHAVDESNPTANPDASIAAAQKAAYGGARPLSPQDQQNISSANAAIQQLNAAYAQRGASTRIQLISQQPMSAVALH